MLDQEGEGGAVEVGQAFYFGLHEGCYGDAGNVGCCVDYADFHRGVGGGDVEIWC